MFSEELLYKILKFAVVGFLSVGIDMGSTYTGREKLKLNQYVANAIGFIFSVTFNFILNRIWTFQSNDANINLQLMKYLTSMTIGLGIMTGIIYVLNEKLKVNFYLAKIMSIGVVMIWNFTINNLLILSK